MSERERRPVTTRRLVGCALLLVAALAFLVWATRPAPAPPASSRALTPRLRVRCELAGATLRVGGAPLDRDADLAAIASGQAPANWSEHGVLHVGEEGRGWASAVWRDEASGEVCVVFQRDGQPAGLARIEARDAEGRPLEVSEGLSGVGRLVPTPRWKRWWVSLFGGQVTNAPQQATPLEPTLELEFSRPGS